VQLVSRKAVISLLTGLLVVGTGAAITLLAPNALRLFATESSAPSDDQLGMPFVFRDAGGRMVLSIRLGPADAGNFDFSVANVGHYRGRANVQQSGPTVFELSGDLAGQFSSTGELPWTGAQVSIRGEVDTRQGQASVNLWSGDAQYHLVTANGTQAAADQTVRQVLTALQTRDWATLYNLENGDLRTTTTLDQFVQSLSGQSAGTLLSMDETGSPTQSMAMGYRYYAQPVTVQWKKPDGSIVTFVSRVHLVLEQNSWRFLGTDPPAS
jgi:hypothetical protein